MKVTVIVPPVVCHSLDPHTGIPFMPHIAAHTAGALRDAGHEVQVIDSFGTDPHRRSVVGEFMLMGVDEAWMVGQLDAACEMVFIYCRTIAEFVAVERLIDLLKEKRPDVHISLFENIQAVTSYSLKPIADKFLDRGADLIILGEPEMRIREICTAVSSGDGLDAIDGLVFSREGSTIRTQDAELHVNLDEVAVPAWDLFTLDGYWSAGFSHAPSFRKKFLPILTSRGCPYKCTFCIAPQVNRKWRLRSAKHIADEMELFYRTLGITEYHVSDLNPTVHDKHTREICEELIRRDLPITWKLAQGTKIETIKNEETLDFMYQAGCRYVSFSPESGSTDLLKIMKKPFDHQHALRMAKKMFQLGIRMQAVFIGGVPGETKRDQTMSVEYAKELIKAGVDEISLVIFTPLPGAELSDAIQGYEHMSACTPSPSWREDYTELQKYRRKMYLTLFSQKILHYPGRFSREMFRVLSKRFETKMEMSLYKQVKLYALRYAPWVYSRIAEEKLGRRAV